MGFGFFFQFTSLVCPNVHDFQAFFCQAMRGTRGSILEQMGHIDAGIVGKKKDSAKVADLHIDPKGKSIQAICEIFKLSICNERYKWDPVVQKWSSASF